MYRTSAVPAERELPEPMRVPCGDCPWTVGAYSGRTMAALAGAIDDGMAICCHATVAPDGRRTDATRLCAAAPTPTHRPGARDAHGGP